jgi:hypothetical protein
MNDLQFPNGWLTDMNAVLRHRSNADNTDDWSTEELNLLADFIEQASADIVGELGWLPLPYVDTLTFDWSREYISRDSKTLWLSLEACLLAITTLTNGDSDILTTAYYALQPNNRFPKKEVKLFDNNSKVFRASSTGQWEQAISIAGIWGYVPHYATCWQATGQTVQNMTQITDTGTDLIVTSTTGFSRGWYLQLESETVQITDVVDTTHLTITRGQLGTTATAHANATVIKRFVQDNIIYRAATEWASYLYKTKDQLGQQVEVYDNSLRIAQGISPTVYHALHKRQRVVVSSAS